MKTDIAWKEAKKRGLKIVKSRWVDGWKPLPDDVNGLRRRRVEQEVNTHDRDDVFSGTSAEGARACACGRPAGTLVSRLPAAARLGCQQASRLLSRPGGSSSAV